MLSEKSDQSAAVWIGQRVEERAFYNGEADGGSGNGQGERADIRHRVLAVPKELAEDLEYTHCATVAVGGVRELLESREVDVQRDEAVQRDVVAPSQLGSDSN